MSNNSVAYSRAGDVFHYRWAARRCLRLIYPNSSIRKIYIEGSQEIEKAGEYVIDVSEYSINDDKTGKIDYYQLKHTTVQHDEPFTISDLKDTFAGFAARYFQHKEKNDPEIYNISFTIITNRKFADSFKENLVAIVKMEEVDNGFQKTIEKYTNLTANDLVSFCSMIQLEDGEGNYNIQKEELRTELAQLIAGSIENAQIENLVALVQEKVLPDSEHSINREEVLKRFGITSEKELYPAPPIWEEPENIVERKQHNILKDTIIGSSHPVIVHAAGGVGKSVFCRQLVNSLPEGSLGISYDCFGAGSYRNRSESRHKHRDALVQIVNELASKGLCDPLIVQNTTLDEDIMRKFLLRLETSLKSLKKTIDSSQLFILIDAADNAEMAAQEYTQSCFAHELLREKFPVDCKLVLLCRTERISLLQPQSFIVQLKLEPFLEEETLENLRKWFPEANEKDGAEFHRLTSGNPRVQANALDVKYDSIHQLLASLGPSGTSVEKQIELQLNSAILKIKDQLPKEHHNQINSICLGLASLPPHISIEVLSKAANVSTEYIKSFVSDIGRSIWLSDTSVQFRDEPTETWFRNTFLATKENYEEYIVILEPLAHRLSYVAEVLPQLYLQSGQYGKLINIALSDAYLPENNPIDARNIRIYRLQFAFKAALKDKNYKDAVKLAMRAGEEVAGNQRQLNFFQANIDLLTALQSKEKVQEIAFKRLLSSVWDGSENVYSASLLSGIRDYHGEARGYLRAATNWLKICFEEQRKKEDPYHYKGVQDNDVLELAYAHLNINGTKDCVHFLFSLKPKVVVFRVVQDFTRRLIDLGRFEEVNELLNSFICEPYYLVATTSELFHVGKFPEANEMEICLDLLCSRKSRIKKPTSFLEDRITPAIISFLEACLHKNLSARKILRVLRYYIPIKATRMVYSSHSTKERTTYLKALAIRAVLSGESVVDIDAISPTEFATKKKNYELDKKVREFKEVINGIFPWYLLRAQIFCIKDIKLLDIVDLISETSKKARTHRYGNFDTLPNEIAQVCSSIMVFYQQSAQEEITEFYQRFLQSDNAFTLQDRLDTLRAAYRSSHLGSVRQQLELSTHELIKSNLKDGPDEIANRYIALARAVLIVSPDDASVYFDEAVNISSKFGDEIVQRWEAVVSLAKRACEKETVSDELTYRFIRCAELVGDNVSREKYWNRNQAISICTRMSPCMGISAISRWRDRDIGRFEYQLEALLDELIRSKVINPKVGWLLTRFFSYHHKSEILSGCLENESSSVIRQNILEDAVYLLKMEGAEKHSWEELKAIADKFNVHNESLNSIIDFHPKEVKPETKEPLGIANDKLYNGPEHDDIFQGLIISTPEGFEMLIERFKFKEKKNDYSWSIRGLLAEIINRLEEKSLWDFIEVILLSDAVNRYDTLNFLLSIPSAWRSKISFNHKWSNTVYRLGEQYAHELTDEYSFNSFVKELNMDKALKEKFISGVISGLANGNEFADANIFFGFVNLVSTFIEIQDAADLVDYSLSRFELHIIEDFGDGCWSDLLKVSKDIDGNIAGFLWSALASPRSEVRWNAAHCVRKLSEFGCTTILDALIEWLKDDKVGAFGHNNYPFYNLHARQYLLMAFARVSIERPRLLLKYSDLFLDYALNQQHVLIQKFAVDIVLNIEKTFHGTYGEEDVKLIKKVGKSSSLIQERDYKYVTDSFWHKEGNVDRDVGFHFGWDFDRYWYEPLGRVFGVPGNQIEDLAAHVIIDEWGLGDKNGYNKDPRVVLWNGSSHERETWHDHGNYPRTDNLDFYLSYHAMLVVASRLLEKMPVVKTRDWPDNPWQDWISRHLLTREDGMWLADCRDALPLKRPSWISEGKKDSWQTDISEEDFLNYLKVEENGELWIIVKGGWNEKVDERIETFSVSTALVSIKTSDALLKALATCSDPHDYKLPDYGEDDMEIESGIFQLKGWISEDSISKGLDKFDPYADEIYYPPYLLGGTIIDRLGLEINYDRKTWQTTNSSKNMLICETWSSHRDRKDEESDRSGIKLKASLPFLKHLCSTFECNLIFDVSIKRDISYYHVRDKKEYAKPQNKIFLLSSDGKLRTTNSNYKLG